MSIIFLILPFIGIICSFIPIVILNALWSEYFVMIVYVFLSYIHYYCYHFHIMMSILVLWLPLFQEYSSSWNVCHPFNLRYSARLCVFFSSIFMSICIIVGRLYLLYCIIIFERMKCSLSVFCSLFGTCIYIMHSLCFFCSVFIVIIDVWTFSLFMSLIAFYNSIFWFAHMVIPAPLGVICLSSVLLLMLLANYLSKFIGMFAV